MSVKIGNIDISKINLGSSPISAVYFQNQKIYPEEAGYLKLKINRLRTSGGLQPVCRLAFKSENLNQTTTGITREIEVSADGTRWTSLSTDPVVPSFMPTLREGSELIFRGTNETYYENIVEILGPGKCYCYFSISTTSDDLTDVDIELSGNIMSLVKGDAFTGSTTLSSGGTFYRMFKNMQITDASGLVLPTNTTSACYQEMFMGCTGLTAAPANIAVSTIAANACYGMFSGCTSLEIAPSLPATTVDYQGYMRMFAGCTSLETAPSTLPSATMYTESYREMFKGCTSLTQTPELPSTALYAKCYYGMFSGCTSLTSASTIPAAAVMAVSACTDMYAGCTSMATMPSLLSTQMDSSCYEGMFRGCTALSTIKTLPATTMASDCYREMFRGCTSITSLPSGILSSTSLSNTCYYGMFRGCSNLATLPNNFLPATTVRDYCYGYMLAGTKITSAPALAATTLAQYCYSHMFDGCTSLVSLNVLPSKQLTGDNCYEYMFANCTSLTSVPTGMLPATGLTTGCYYGMFSGCTSLLSNTSHLNNLPTISATTLQLRCYGYMFSGCSSISHLPSGYLSNGTLASSCYVGMFMGSGMINANANLLPKTVLASSCYAEMFKNCSYLTTAPELSATTLTANCYQEMFSGCSSLHTIKCYATSISATDCTTNWVNGVPQGNGNFYCRSSAQSAWEAKSTGGIYSFDGIPNGWTVHAS